MPRPDHPVLDRPPGIALCHSLRDGESLTIAGKLIDSGISVKDERTVRFASWNRPVPSRNTRVAVRT